MENNKFDKDSPYIWREVWFLKDYITNGIYCKIVE